MVHSTLRTAQLAKHVASGAEDQVAGALRESGFSSGQIAVLALLVFACAAVFFAFTLLGCFFFLGALISLNLLESPLISFNLPSSPQT